MITIICDKVTHRHRYLFDWISAYFGIEYRISDRLHAAVANSAVIAYTSEKKSNQGGIWIKNEGLLDSHEIKAYSPNVAFNDDIPQVFPNESDLGFDIFSAIFYMISRYEEYSPFEADVHGRFPAKESFAAKHHFLEIPVVDIWLEQLKKVVQNQYPQLQFKTHRFSTLFTYDIDIAYKYLGRSAGRQFLAIGKDILTLQWYNLAKRLKVLLGAESDPWDIYDYLKKELNEHQINVLFFFLSGSRSEYDHNLHPQNRFMIRLLNDTEGYAKTGIHPSYFSSKNPQLFSIEMGRLTKALHKSIEDTRQHFLKFSIPSTYEHLYAAGLKRDYSMAFADAPGFRSGTTIPFQFYNLKEEKTIPITVYSPCWMDATFTNYLHRNPEAALQKAVELIAGIKVVNGLFIPIFHNDLLSERSWREVHHSLAVEVSKR